MNFSVLKKQLFDLMYSMPYDIFKNFVVSYYENLSDTDKEDFILFLNNLNKGEKENV